MVQVVLQARENWIGDLVKKCARNEVGFDELCRRVAAAGYRTTSLYEMVIAAERADATQEKG